MQIYKYMNIGSAKPTKEEMHSITHYMIDFVEPNERYSVADYKKQAEKYIEQILAKGKTPIIVGGTGLYINSLIYAIEYNETKIDEEYRKELEERAEREGIDILYEEAYKIDKKAMQSISPNDKKRIIRVLEIYKQTRKTKTELEAESRKEIKYNYKVFVTNMERSKLYERINRRVDIMIEQGLIEETKKILSMYDEFPTAMQAIGYKEIKEYLDGILTKEEAIEKIKQESRRYAKRQLTWFRKLENTTWLDMSKTIEENIMEIINEK